MRILNIVLCAFMVLFAAVQWNDPDGPLWMALYAVPAIWAGIAGFRPVLLQAPAARVGLAISFVLYALLTIYFWPPDANWWLIDVWWESEEAREGMGMMIATAVIAIAGLTALGRRASPVAAGQA